MKKNETRQKKGRTESCWVPLVFEISSRETLHIYNTVSQGKGRNV